MSSIKFIFKKWLLHAALVTLLCGIIYTIAQQVYRQSANDPQFQLAEDAAAAIANGTVPNDVIKPGDVIEISQSLAPWTAVYAAGSTIIATNATLNGKAPAFPGAVFKYVRKWGTEALTWQPAPGIRQATVVIAAKGYMVVAGRSLRKTEERIGILGQQVLFAWAVSLVALFVWAFFVEATFKNAQWAAKHS